MIAPYQMEVRQDDVNGLLFAHAKLMNAEPGGDGYPGDVWRHFKGFDDERKCLEFALRIAMNTPRDWEPREPVWMLVDADFDRGRLKE